ncbi:hypothetical protein F383_10234 [Gossypium arboreum]|uniref:Uncharacterized protein n=1 Tax=Gossypium arboreum TaxID=29729 RepID=A0A0B0NWD4_GOSAR|nr:hypothetical protein F383_10234 [Gossypium arboreum]
MAHELEHEHVVGRVTQVSILSSFHMGVSLAI